MKILFGFLFVLLLTSPSVAQRTLHLKEAIQAAIDYDPGLKSVQHAARAESLSVDLARARTWPYISLEGRTSFVDNVPSFQLDLPVPNPPVIETGTQESYQADLTLSYPLYAGGRLDKAITLQQFIYKASSSAYTAAHLKTAYMCRVTYLNVLLARWRNNTARASQDRLEIIMQNVRHLLEHGLADSLDYFDAGLALEQGREHVITSRTEFRNAEIVLLSLIGHDTSEQNLAYDSLDRPSNNRIESLQSAGALTEPDRPELTQLDFAIMAADQQRHLSHSEYMPQVSAFAGYSIGKPNRDFFDKGWDDYFRVGMTLSWQFNLGGSVSKNIAIARQQADAARRDRDNLATLLNRGVTTAMNSVQTAYQTIELVARQLQLAERKFELASQRQAVGSLSTNRLLEMEAELTVSRQKYAVALTAFYLAESEYLYAIGSDKIYGGLQ